MLLFFEGLGHIYLMIKHKNTGKSSQDEAADAHRFRIRDYVDNVSDERRITLKKNYSGTYKIKIGPSQTLQEIDIETDLNGFRAGGYKYFRDKENIVFIGDSVPFGYSTSGSDSYPAIIYRLIHEKSGLGVINAAIPSSSLYQAIKRYEYEIDNRFPVKTLVVQVFDPATQFLVMGRNSNKKMCWLDSTGMNQLMKEIDSIRARKIYKYSSIYRIMADGYIRYKEIYSLPANLDMEDKQAFDLFRDILKSTLDELYVLTEKKSVKIVILPANPKALFKPGDDSFDNKRLKVVEYMNNVFMEYAESKKNVYFIDVRKIFPDSQEEREEYFSDALHLTVKGSKKQAQYLADTMEELKLY
jgi:hypothetical protein